MKTKTFIQLSFFFIALLVISLASCKKESSTTTSSTTTPSTSLQNLVNDENQVNNASDDALNDINNVLGGGQGTMKETESIPCNATLDSTAVQNDTITYYITYNGLNCNQNIYRTGQVEIKKRVGTHWYQAGATVIYSYINFHLYHVSNPAKWITINGTKTYQDVTGGLLFMLLTGDMDSIVHKEWGYMKIEFENNTTKTWDVDRQLTYTKDTATALKLKLKTNGLGSADNYNNLIVWGINRDNEQFYDQILVPNIFRQKCDWDPCSGERKFVIPAANKGDTIFWGYNSNNQPISGNECPTKFKVDWWNGNNMWGVLYLFLP
jgi:hypothetical protein